MSTANTSKPFEITEDDIGVEGKYLWLGKYPATLLTILHRTPKSEGVAVFQTVGSDGVETVAYSRVDGTTLWEDRPTRDAPLRRQSITKVRRKLYAAVRCSTNALFVGEGRLPAIARSYWHQTRKEAIAGAGSWDNDPGTQGIVHVFEVAVDSDE